MNTQVHSPDQFIIGLTGNIGTGKSTVLNMLRRLGAYGIDADQLTRHVYDQHTAQQAIIDTFGGQILNGSGRIDRIRVARIVFNDAQALQNLEAIIHPYVTRACTHLTRSSRLPIIVIEAIKLLESDLTGLCDSIWVVDAKTDAITRRLVEQRGMSVEQVQERLSNQSAVHEKVKYADVLIQNDNDLRSTWGQVLKQRAALIEGNTRFGQLDQQTAAIFAGHKVEILRPFSADLSRIANLDQFDLMPAQKRIEPADLHQLAANFMTLSNQDRNLSAWQLSTFDMACHGYLVLQGDHKKPCLPFSISEVETLANTYHIANITIPVHHSLKEETRQIRENGYMVIDHTADTFLQWKKAGYNVFINRLWNIADVFNDEKSPSL